MENMLRYWPERWKAAHLAHLLFRDRKYAHHLFVQHVDFLILFFRPGTLLDVRIQMVIPPKKGRNTGETFNTKINDAIAGSDWGRLQPSFQDSVLTSLGTACQSCLWDAWRWATTSSVRIYPPTPPPCHLLPWSKGPWRSPGSTPSAIDADIAGKGKKYTL